MCAGYDVLGIFVGAEGLNGSFEGLKLGITLGILLGI